VLYVSQSQEPPPFQQDRQNGLVNFLGKIDLAVGPSVLARVRRHHWNEHRTGLYLVLDYVRPLRTVVDAFVSPRLNTAGS
jgi:hypothetical protein